MPQGRHRMWRDANGTDCLSERGKYRDELGSDMRHCGGGGRCQVADVPIVAGLAVLMF